MLFLLTNDDGIHSRGLRILADSLREIGKISVVAPDRERSAAAHSLTLHRPLRAEQISTGWYSVDGTPTDCINLGVFGLLKRKPDMIISGINRGGNLGDDIMYSGTVAAAVEGCLLEIPSFAISLVVNRGQHYETAASIAELMVKKIRKHGLPHRTFLNVNVPDVAEDKLQGIRITRQGRKQYGETIVERKDPRGGAYYWVGAGEVHVVPIEGCDIEAVADAYVSVTPLHLDMTNYPACDILKGWNLSRAER